MYTASPPETEELCERLPTENVLALFSPTGPIAQGFHDFELRPEQTHMLANVIEAFNKNQIALVEAGTGTGKSLAYLVPALLWAHKTGERIVISTNTIPLQEQLLHKDIPALIQSLKVPVKTILMKGMSNFLCLRKMKESLEEMSMYPPIEAQEVQKIDAWANAPGCNGERASLPFPTSSNTWERVGAESDACNKNQCPFYQQCFYFNMRKRAQDAKILIVNHHLLFSDLVLKNSGKEGAGVIPAYSRVILDEAHNIEDIATDYFASRVSQLDIMRLLARLTSEKGGKEHGKLVVLKQKLHETYKDTMSHAITSIHQRLNIDLPGMRHDVLFQTRQTFDILFNYSQKMGNKGRGDRETSHTEQKLRLVGTDYGEHAWTQGVDPAIKLLTQSLKRFCQGLYGIITDIKLLKDGNFQETVASLTFEIEALAGRIQMLAAETETFIHSPPGVTSVRWIELQALKTMINTAMVDAKLDIAEFLATTFFSKIPSVILCSATLTTNGQFSFIRQRLGLTAEHLKDRTIKEYMYHSPFDYQSQMFLGIPNDLPLPNDPSFTKKAAEAICRLVEASRGNAFVLFTSYSMMSECFTAVKKSLLDSRYNLMKQGDAERHQLLRNFTATEKSVLFGTDSFWEGIDIGGDALRCVIIVKLPFKAPNDPIIEARSEAIAQNGGDPFMTYALPQAIVKFKQGLGRLIRQKSDRGCVICLDQRIITKRYGSQFLQSLPRCKTSYDTQEALVAQMTEFYRATNYLAKRGVQRPKAETKR